MKLNDALKSIKKNTNAESLEESTLAKVTDYLSTGNYAINRVLTGDIYKGFPAGRISCIAGASQSGKSLLAANTVIEALKNDKVDIVYIFDSEGGVLVRQIKNKPINRIMSNNVKCYEENNAE